TLRDLPELGSITAGRRDGPGLGNSAESLGEVPQVRDLGSVLVQIFQEQNHAITLEQGEAIIGEYEIVSRLKHIIAREASDGLVNGGGFPGIGFPDQDEPLSLAKGFGEGVLIVPRRLALLADLVVEDRPPRDIDLMIGSEVRVGNVTGLEGLKA